MSIVLAVFKDFSNLCSSFMAFNRSLNLASRCRIASCRFWYTARQERGSAKDPLWTPFRTSENSRMAWVFHSSFFLFMIFKDFFLFFRKERTRTVRLARQVWVLVLKDRQLIAIRPNEFVYSAAYTKGSYLSGCHFL